LLASCKQSAARPENIKFLLIEHLEALGEISYVNETLPLRPAEGSADLRLMLTEAFLDEIESTNLKI
jgi:hypothetical protein